MAVLHAKCFTTPKPWSAQDFETVMADPICFTLFASHGFVIGRAVASEAEILTLAVDPVARRGGLGKSLLQCFLNEARARQATSAFLEVSEANPAAVSLYLKAGFAEVGRRKGYYKRPEAAPLDALVLSRSL